MKTPKFLQSLIVATWVALSLGLGSTAVLAATKKPPAPPAATNAPASQATCDSSKLTLTSGIGCGSTSSASSKPLFSQGGLFNQITNTLIYVIGAVSVLMIIIGGLRYVLSAGNASSVEGAKNTIMYAVIGMVVAIMAYAIIQFVLSRVG